MKMRTSRRKVPSCRNLLRSHLPLCSARIHMNAHNERHHGASVSVSSLFCNYTRFTIHYCTFFFHRVSVGNERISVSRIYKRRMMKSIFQKFFLERVLAKKDKNIEGYVIYQINKTIVL